MNTGRRDLLKAVTGASVAIEPLSGGAKAAAVPSPAADLIAAGLDPLTVYRKMFASAGKDGGCYWMFTGPFPVEIDDVGPVYFMQEETLRAMRTETIGPDAVKMNWREAGTLRDMQTGNVVTSIYDPRTGERTAHKGNLHTDPASFTISKSGDSLLFAILFPHAYAVGVTAAASVKGDRVSLTVYTEFKLSAASKSSQISTMKIYSSLADLKSGAPFVAAQGFYSIRDKTTGAIEISGIMRKAELDEKLDPAAWDRVRGFLPDFFDGDKVAVNWK